MAVDAPDSHLLSKRWRMNNLYMIVNKEGKEVLFRFNEVQEDLFVNIWDMNVILKARQEGFTTFICIYFLDECLFNSNVEAGIIAHTKDDAGEIFRRKIQFPYEHLPPEIAATRTLTTDSKVKMGFSNGSVMSVGTSMRSATLQYLLVSELGKIAKMYPEKAREIMTGSLETVGKGDTLIFVESTGEGRSGAYYDLCDRARKLEEANKALTRMDFRFHFYPWFDCPDYVLHEPVSIKKEMSNYFRDVEVEISELRGPFKLTQAQKAWYIKKRDNLGDDIKREYPSTPDEAFESGIQGTYFKTQFRRMREDGRITKVPHQGGIAVDVWMDLGMDDSMSLWFTQDIGRELHVINYYENNGEGLEFYKDYLDGLRSTHRYQYGRIVAPFDIKVRELGTGVSRLETARNLGMQMEVAPKVEKKMDGIQKTRSLLGSCWFDEENCGGGLDHMEDYRKEWDPVHGVYRDSPLHNADSHAADAFQTLSTAHTYRQTRTGRPRARKKAVRIRSSKGWA